jgi:hypothetical protein
MLNQADLDIKVEPLSMVVPTGTKAHLNVQKKSYVWRTILDSITIMRKSYQLIIVLVTMAASTNTRNFKRKPNQTK